jgi:nucleotide-binding universal stress UspA family protein
MFKHLLVPLDGSALAEKALAPALCLAQPFASEITLLRIAPPPYMAAHVSGSAYGDLILNLRRMACEEALAYLKAQQGLLRQQGYKVHIHLLEGESVAELILNVIDSLGIDGVVMSTHGRGGLNRWVFGSVADRVLRRAPVPLLLIRAADKA